MSTASQRPTSKGKSGASTSSNETPVSTAEQPNPPSDPNTRASRPPKPAPQTQATDDTTLGAAVSPKPADKANGRDHPTESEHDHAHQKLKGTSAERP